VLTEAPAGSGFVPHTHIDVSTLYPIATEEWMANSATSTWISAQADQSAFPNDVGQGNYAFRTTFDLNGFDPASAQISGQWAVDDLGLDILINGASTGFTHNHTLTFGSFSITAGFVAGLNTLDFLVRNEPFGGDINPMGLRVELSGTADPVPVPETLTLLPDPISATASSAYPDDVPTYTYGPQNLYDQNPTASDLNQMIDIGAEY
jgi:hypothetical protein